VGTTGAGLLHFASDRLWWKTVAQYLEQLRIAVRLREREEVTLRF
jgi:hypothetical protein